MEWRAIHSRMFIREKIKSNKGKKKLYKYHLLVESYRSDTGPRQRILLNLGELDINKEKWPLLAQAIQEIVSGQKTLLPAPQYIQYLAQQFAQQLLVKYDHSSESELIDHSEHIDMSSIQPQRARSIGPENISLTFFHQLGLPDFLLTLGFSPRQVEIACLLIIGRLCNPGSERHLYHWGKYNSGLDELLETDFTHLSLNSLYTVSDRLIRQQKKIESYLRKKECSLFGLDEKLILYDLTNTYFEGTAAQNKKAKFGRSKEKRSDCRLVTLGLVLDGQGFPKVSRIFDGNQSEPKTLLSMVKRLEELSGSDTESPSAGKKTVVMDAGIATEENLKQLSESYHYICVSRKKRTIPDEGDEYQIIKETPDMTIKVSHDESDGDVYLFCQSSGKQQKERGIQSRLEQNFEEQLSQIAAAVHKKGGTKKYSKVCERIGRAREKYKRIAHYYTVTVHEHEGIATKVEWEYTKKSQSDMNYSGSYILRTDRTDLDNAQIWDVYMMLLEVEDAFKTMKSELGIRPNFHHKEHRSDGHLFITVLAYHIVHCIRTTLKEQGIKYRWETIRQALSTHQRITTRLRTIAGKAIYVRSCSEPEPFHKMIYDACGVKHTPIKNKEYSF